MTGVDKSLESFAGFGDFFAAHRIGHVKQNSDRNGRVGIAEKSNFLFVVVIENRKSFFC